jgi:hypothetical protein
MSASLLSCPYCNAEVPLAAGLPAGHKVTCTRCGEAFALQQPTTAIQAAPGVTAAPPAGAKGWVAPALPRARWAAARSANRRLAALVLGVMVLMAGVGLAYALWTQDYRRQNDRGLVKRRPLRPTRPESEPDPGPVAPVNPLSALGYLPADTNVVLVGLVPQLRAGDAGKQLFGERLNVLGRPLSLERLAEWAGLAPDNIELLALGTRADDQLIPALTLVVRTRRPYDEKKVLAALEAKPRNVAGDARNEVYSLTLKGTPKGRGQAMLWCADRRTLVLRGLAANMGDVPRQAEVDYKHLPSVVRELIAQRVEAKAPLWAVGEVASWAEGWPALFAGRLPPEEAARLRLVRTFALSVRPERPSEAVLGLGAVSEAAAGRLEAHFRARGAKVKGMTVTRDGEWVSLRWAGDLAEARQALGW